MFSKKIDGGILEYNASIQTGPKLETQKLHTPKAKNNNKKEENIQVENPQKVDTTQ